MKTTANVNKRRATAGEVILEVMGAALAFDGVVEPSTRVDSWPLISVERP